MMHPIPRNAVRIAIPDVTQQTGYSCGPSCLESIARFYGVGKEDEWEFVRGLRMDHRAGSHPYQIRRLARSYRLHVREYNPMSFAQLHQELRWRHPVMLMIQAYGRARLGKRRLTRWRRNYIPDWDDGHWVVAIGYDREGVFFEDPSIQARRGWLSRDELMCRWHDTGPHGRHLPFYGVAIWRPGHRQSSYAGTAERIL
ncbi:MAG: C39 family peptidase [Acidobacteria bacterium]|nr:C39 family peptidase [Acidobacteriota bacterium]